MSPTSIAEAEWTGLQPAVVSGPVVGQRDRIIAVLGLTDHGVPRVGEKTLARYHKYLSANLSLPFVAYYPEPTNAQERTQFRCNVVELLDPAEWLGDEFDGLFCKTRKGKFEVNLPLVELHLPEDDPNFQLIDDYCYWFWNWR
jgi:hypothetical protein